MPRSPTPHDVDRISGQAQALVGGSGVDTATTGESADTDDKLVQRDSDRLYVRYMLEEGDSRWQNSEFTHLSDSIPDKAFAFCNAVYHLTHDQLQALKAGEKETKTVRNECSSNGQPGDVWFFPHIETDDFDDADLREDCVDALRDIVRGLGLDPDEDCTVYSSGRRSIHVHPHRLLDGARQCEKFRRKVKALAKDYDVNIDPSVTKPHQPFRIPGVDHSGVDTTAVKAKADWDSMNPRQMLGQSLNGDEPKPDTFNDFLNGVFLQNETITRDVPYDCSHDFWQINVDAAEFDWMPEPAYDAEYPFSPYANAGNGNGRSVAVGHVIDDPFTSDIQSVGESDEYADREYTFVPTEFYGAAGCDERFTMAEWETSTQRATLKLSASDARKWADKGLKPGDCFALIGGQSRNSRLFSLSESVATEIGEQIGEGGRDAAIQYMKDSLGHDVGESGMNGTEEFDDLPAGPDPTMDSEPSGIAADGDGRSREEVVERLCLKDPDHENANGQTYPPWFYAMAAVHDWDPGQRGMELFEEYSKGLLCDEHDGNEWDSDAPRKFKKTWNNLTRGRNMSGGIEVEYLF